MRLASNVVLVVALAACVHAKPREIVGPFGDLAAARFEGCDKIPPRQLVVAMRQDLPIQFALTPSAPLDSLLATLEQRLVLGYRSMGFADAQVRIEPDRESGRLLFRISEGRQLLAGEIRFVGTTLLKIAPPQPRDAPRPNKDPLINEFVVSRTERGPVKLGMAKPVKKSQPQCPPGHLPRDMWEPGEPADLVSTRDHLTLMRVSQAMSELGFFESRIAMERQRDGDKVHLVFKVDEGPRATLAKIEITGAKRNTPAEITRLLGWREGMPVDYDTLISAQQKLWDSGRFWHHWVSAICDPAGSGRITLLVELDEHKSATPLGQPLRPEEEAMLKCRNWLLRSLAQGSDVSIEGIAPFNQAIEIQFAISADGGTAMRINSAPPAAPPPATPATAPGTRPGADIVAHTSVWAGRTGPGGSASEVKNEVSERIARWVERMNLGALFATDRVALYDLAARRRFAFEGRMSHKIDLELTLLPKKDAPGPEFRIGGGVASRSKDETPVRFTLAMAPVCFLHMAQGEWESTREAGVLTLARKGDGLLSTIRVEEASGRLIEATQRNLATGRIEGRASVGPGLVQKLASSLDQASRNALGTYPNQPARTFAAMAIHWLCDSPLLGEGLDARQRLAAAAAIEKLCSAEVLEHFKGELNLLPFAADGEFSIPVDVEAAARGEQPGGFAWLVPAVDNLFTRQSWQWTLLRQMLLGTGNWRQYAQLELGRLYGSSDMGPIGCLVIAQLFTEDPGLSRLFAKRGLERLTAEGFDADCRALLDGDAIIPRIGSGMVRSMARLEEADIQALAMLLPPSARSAAGELAKAARVAPGDRGPATRPSRALSSEAQKKVWESGLRDLVEQRLKLLAGTPSTPR